MMNEQADRIKRNVEIFTAQYVRDETIGGQVYAEAKLAIKLGLRVFVESREDLDTFVGWGVKPSKISMPGEYPDNPVLSE